MTKPDPILRADLERQVREHSVSHVLMSRVAVKELLAELRECKGEVEAAYSRNTELAEQVNTYKQREFRLRRRLSQWREVGHLLAYNGRVLTAKEKAIDLLKSDE